MLEKFPKKVTTSLAVAAGALVLAGCGKDEHRTWRIGVNCPANARTVHVENLTQDQTQSEFSITCDNGSSKQTPSGLELLSGQGAIIHQPNTPTAVIAVDYTHNTQQACSPTVDLTIGTKAGLAIMNCIEGVQSVQVG